MKHAARHGCAHPMMRRSQLFLAVGTQTAAADALRVIWQPLTASSKPKGTGRLWADVGVTAAAHAKLAN